MRFFKDILSRGDHDAEQYDAEYAGDQELEYDDQPEIESDDDDWAEPLDEQALEAALRNDPADDEERENFDDAQLDNTRADDLEVSDAESDENDLEIPIWELVADNETNNVPETPETTVSDDATLTDLARAAMQTIDGRIPPPEAAPNGGRAKTRLLGFHRGADVETDVFTLNQENPAQTPQEFPVGWLVVIEGPGRGAHFTLYDGVAKIGRGADQTVSLDFGDSSISRDNHAAIAYDEEQNTFFLGHGGKANLVRLNGKPVLSTEEISDGDFIRIGETTMRFAAFCRPEFSWDLMDEDEANCA